MAESPRQILRAQAERAAEKGLVALAGTELEFIVFNDTYEQAWDAGYRGLTPANQYNVDYSLLGTSRVEPLLRDIRNGMFGAGLVVESAKGECNLGQHEIAFKYDEVVRTADNHSIYKNGAKEIASQHGKALTFMAKFDQREGNSCHIHMSLRGTDGGIVFDEGDGPTPMFQQLRRRHPGHDVRASPCSTRRTSTPTSGSSRAASPRRRPPGATTTAPARCASSATAPGCGWRTGCPAATSTPTSPWPACSASGLRGIEQELELEPAYTGQRLRVRPPQGPDVAAGAPATCSPASAIGPGGASATRWSTTTSTTPTSSWPRSTAAVTDWERYRVVREDVTVAEAATSAPTRSSTPPPRSTSRRSTSTSVEETDEAIARGARARSQQWRQRRPRRPGPAAAPVRRRGRRRRARSSPPLEVRNSGHTISNARWEAGNVRDVLDYYAAAPERLFGRQIPVAGGVDITFKEPLGVVAVIVPWNFPMPIAGWGLAPALAAGNTVVLKPAEITPLTAIRLGELALEAGLPPGRVHRPARQGLGRRRPVRDAPARPQDRVHRLDRGRDRDHGPGRRAR